MAIQDILKGNQPKPNRGANTAYIQQLLDYATDTDLKQTQYETLMAFAQARIPIAQENMASKAVQMMAQKGISPAMIGTPQPSAVDQLYGT
jgi:hypothetical protein